ncbi:uncharacterized protein PgNI_11601 [Pyricularia grisea]|uniref:Uncharacterized protein n=1 Tax=Pyricularia grisea TaxID=148305 RepID=A0A6P8AN18_PYRGI|nr:uncharacterized protein PgNI_11601 [Pyricularia grisea]TLD03438.1 hypothetical protein PgNI_11601 [Pyricularia grisea]
MARHGADAHDVQVRIELVEHHAHTVEKAAHVAAATGAGLALGGPESVAFLILAQRGLEGVKVGHPLLGKGRVLHVCLVEDEDHGELGLVQDAAGVEHVAHECAGRAGLDLAGSVHQDVLDGLAPGILWRVSGCALLQQVQYLVNLCREQVQRCEDAAVGSQVVLLHDLLVVDRVADVDVAVERDVEHGRVEVDDIRRVLLAM